MTIIKMVVVLLLCTAIKTNISAQDFTDSLLASTAAITTKYIDAVDRKADRVSGDIDKQTEKYLAQLEKQEAKL